MTLGALFVSGQQIVMPIPSAPSMLYASRRPSTSQPRVAHQVSPHHMTPILSLRQIHKRFGAIVIADGIDLDANR